MIIGPNYDLEDAIFLLHSVVCSSRWWRITTSFLFCLSENYRRGKIERCYWTEVIFWFTSFINENLVFRQTNYILLFYIDSYLYDDEEHTIVDGIRCIDIRGARDAGAILYWYVKSAWPIFFTSSKSYFYRLSLGINFIVCSIENSSRTLLTKYYFPSCTL